MKAMYYEAFGQTPEIRILPDPEPTEDGVVVKVEATGLCRSDWHGWMGHDPDISLPHVPGHELAGRVVAKEEAIAVIESVKAVSDLYAPVSGTVIEINATLGEDPAVLNDDPVNEGWIIRIEMDTEKELASLMRAPDYKKLIAEANK